MEKTKKIIFCIILLICLIAVWIALVYVEPYYAKQHRSEEVNQELRDKIETLAPGEDVQGENGTEEAPAESAVIAVEELEEALRRVVDFEAIQAETNKDIYAWIYIPDTNIDYPILQHPTDDTYYLNYNIDGSKGYPGCIYTELINSKDFTDFQTLIYGHNMKNGTMFHNLRYYKDETYFKEHQYLYIYLPDRTLKYQIYAAYQYDDRHLMYAFDYSNEDVRKGYIEDILNMKSSTAVIDKEAEVNADSRIITLSTCIGGQDTQRYLVQAVLVDEFVSK